MDWLTTALTRAQVMTVAADAQVLRLDELVERDGIFHRSGQDETEYKRRWEAEASEDHVASAIARGSAGVDDYETLTAKITPLWDRLPRRSQGRDGSGDRLWVRSDPALSRT